MKLYFLSFFTITVILGCSKPNPNPELLDPIYLDIQSELGAKESALKTAEELLKQREEEEKSVVPQTGQIKFARKRLYDAEKSIERLKQEIKYLELRLQSRKREAKQTYITAYHDKKPWPNPSEWQTYQEKKKVMSDRGPWNVNARIEELNGPKKKVAPASHE